MPLISIIVPIYNTKKFIPRCLDSLINQTITDIEIILINDGSTDNSLSVIEGYMQKDQRIKCINQKNGGQSSARNAGLQAAKGEYIGFVDSDDYIEKDMYEVLYNLAVTNSAQIAVCNYCEVTDTTITPRDKVKDEVIDFKDITREDYIFKYLRTHLHSNQLCTRLYERTVIYDNSLSFLVSVKNSVAEIAEDLLFNLKATFYINKVAATSRALYYYYQREGSSMFCVKPQLINRMVTILQDFEGFTDRLKNKNDLPRLMQRLIYSVICEESTHYIEDGRISQLKNDFKAVYNNPFLDKYIKVKPLFTLEKNEKALKLAYALRFIRLYILAEQLRAIKIKLNRKIGEVK